MSVANSSNITTIQILRSYSNSAPITLDDGQLAFSFVSNTLFIGSNTGIKVVSNPSTDIKAQAAYNQANTATVLADAGYFHANGAFIRANAAFDNSNTKFNSSGGTITGNVIIANNKDLTVTGNLFVQGEVVTVNTTSFSVNDSVIILAVGNYTSDIKDIGFAGHYNNGVNAHTGLIRDSVVKEWVFFQDYTPELSDSNNLNMADPSFQFANTQANWFKGNLLATTARVGGLDIKDFATAAFVQANVTVGVDATQNTRLTVIEGTDLSQNVRLTFSNTRMDISDGVNASQNVRLDFSNTRMTIIEGVDVGQNSRMTIIENTDVSQNVRLAFSNTRMDISDGVNTTQNTRLAVIENTDLSQNVRLNFSNTRMDISDGVNASQNVRLNFSNTRMAIIEGVDVTQNTNIAATNQYATSAFSTANNAYTKANNALANTTGTFAGTLTVTGNVIANSFITSGSSGIISGANFVYANTFVSSNAYIFPDGTVQTTAASTAAFSNGAFNQANTATVLAQAAYNQANVTIGVDATQNTRLSVAEGVDLSQNVRLDFSNTRMTIIENTDVSQNVRLAFSNTRMDISDGVNASQNVRLAFSNTRMDISDGVNASQNVRLDFSNAAITIIQGVNATQNTRLTVAEATDVSQNVRLDFSNTRMTIIEGVNTSQNSRMTIIEGTDTSQNNRMSIIEGVNVGQNTAIAATDGKMQAAYFHANGAFIKANSAFDAANLQIGVDNTQNTRMTVIEGTNVSQNARMTIIEGVDVTQNTNIANKLSLTGAASQTVTGNVVFGNDVTVTGNLVVLGNTISLNVTSIEVEDTLIQLGIGNYTTDALSIGYVGHYNDGTNAHAGFIRDALTKEFYAFQGYTPEVTGNVININAASFAKANIQGNWFKGNLIATTARVGGLDIGNFATAAYNQANTGTVLAQASFSLANATVGVDATQNTRLTVIEGTNASQNVRLDFSNTRMTISDGVNVTQNTAIAATDNKMQSAYNVANTADVRSVSAYFHANGAFFKANAAFDQANVTIGVDATQNTRMTVIEGTDVGQNSRMTIIENTDVSQNVRLAFSNTRMDISDGVNASQNVRLDYSNTALTIAQGVDNSQNVRLDFSNAAITIIQGVDVTQNTRLTVSEGVDLSQNVRLDYSNTALTIAQGVDNSQNVRLDYSNTAINQTLSAWTANTVVVANSAGFLSNSAMRFDASISQLHSMANVSIGTSVSSAPLTISKSFTLPTGGEQFGQLNSIAYSVADTNLKQGLRLNTVAQHTSNTTTDLMGLLNLTTASGVGGTTLSQYAYWARNDVAAGAFVTNSYNYFSNNNGNTGNANNQFGFYTANLTKGLLSNYGFYGAVNTGNNAFNLYMAGTAPNFLAGSLTVANNIPSTSNTTGSLVVTGGLGVSGNTFLNNSLAAVTTTASAVNYVQVTGGTANGPNGNGASISVQGSSTDADMYLAAKGLGRINVASKMIVGNAAVATYYSVIAPADGLIVANTINGGAIGFGGTNGRSLSAYQGGVLSNFDMYAAQTFYTGDLLVTGRISSPNSTSANLQLTTTDANSTVFINRTVYIANANNSVSNTTGGLVVRGGIATGGAIYSTGGSITINNGLATTGNSGTIFLGDSSFSKTFGSGFIFNSTISAQQFLANAGSNSAAAFTFSGVGNLGIYAPLTGVLGITANSANALFVSTPASSVNHLQISGAIAGNYPTINAIGPDSSVGITYNSKNSGVHFFQGAGGTQFTVLPVFNGSASVNYLQASGNSAGNPPVLTAAGSDTNIDVNVISKGSGVINLNNGGGTIFQAADNGSVTSFFRVYGGTGINVLESTGSGASISSMYRNKGAGNHAFATAISSTQFLVSHTASAVNWIQVTGSATGLPTVLSTQGSDPSVPIIFSAKGPNGYINFTTENTGNSQFIIIPTSNVVNQLRVTGSTIGVGPRLYSEGTDTNINLLLLPKGSGSVNVTSTAASTSNTTGALVVSGGLGLSGNLSMNLASSAAAVNRITLSQANFIYSDTVATGSVAFGGTAYYYFNNSIGVYNQNALIQRGPISNDQGNTTVLFAGSSPVKIQNGTASSNTTSGALVVQGGVGISGALNATTKSFNIPHPTKEGKNLRYGSLEGPEFGVYVRGTLKGSNVIELPDYWTKLVDANTITVSLTPIGKHQKLSVKEIKDNTIIVNSDEWFKKEIHCYYTVFGERADVDKLDVEV